MSPDIEWRVGEDAKQETIARTTSSARRASHRRWIVITTIGLGVILGLLYRSIPEPPSKPIGSAPIPTVIASPLALLSAPESLEAALERDALRLASSAGEANHMITFADVGDKYADWYAALQNAFGRWGTPLDQALYTVSASGTLPSGVAWATLGQFRHDTIYHDTRFYRLENNRWVWTLPDRSFWSGKTTVITISDASPLGPVIIRFPIEDASLTRLVVEHFSQVYQTLCANLKCPPPTDQPPSWTPGPTISLTIKPMLIEPMVQSISQTLFIDLPSPNVVGIYDKANGLGDPYVAMAYATLIEPMVRLASGDYARWDTNDGGRLFLQAIATWQRARLPNDLALLDTYFQAASPWPSTADLANGQPVSRRADYVNQFRDIKLIPLNDLWPWPKEGANLATVEQLATREANAMIIFIEEKYGPDGVVRFLNALGQARSLETAIKTAFSIEYVEFDQQWNKWIAGK